MTSILREAGTAMNDDSKAPFIVTKDQLLELQLAGMRYGRSSTVENLKAMDQKQLACMQIEFPHLEHLKYGIVTLESIDAVIELQRRVFPHGSETDLKTP